MAKAEITVTIADLPQVKARLDELAQIGAALRGEAQFPRTEIGDAIHNLRGRAEAAEQAIAGTPPTRRPPMPDLTPAQADRLAAIEAADDAPESLRERVARAIAEAMCGTAPSVAPLLSSAGWLHLADAALRVITEDARS